MKKLLSVFAAAAMLFGFASCSGDLHDDVASAGTGGAELNGSWYYISAGTPDGTPTVIFNNADKQSANLPCSKSTGNVFYKIDDTKEVEEEDYGSIRKRWFVEEISEEAAKALGWEDKGLSGLAIYCFAPFDPIAKGLKVYTHSPVCFGAWSGAAMSNDGAALAKYTINMNFTFDISAYEKSTGKTVGDILLTGEAFGWGFPENFDWGNISKDNQVVSKNGSVSLTYTLETADYPAETGELQLVIFEKGINGKDATASDFLKQTANFKAPTKDASGSMFGNMKNEGFKSGATINVLLTVDADGVVTGSLK